MNERPSRFFNSLLLDFMTPIYNVFFMPSKPHNKKTKRKNTSLRLEESVLKTEDLCGEKGYKRSANYRGSRGGASQNKK